MANVLQLKRGTTTRRLTYTPAPGEPVVDLTQNKLYYGNGTTVGGVAVQAEDNSKVLKVLPLSTAQAYRDVASFYNSGAAAKGAIVIHLPTSKNAANTMMQIKIKGYNNLTSASAFELLCGFYQNNSSNISQSSAVLLGSFPSDQVRYAKAADHTVIILGNVDTTWAYPNIYIPEVVCSHSDHTGWENGWSISIETDLSAYTVKATPSTLAKGFENNLVDYGYQKLPSGLIFQWGTSPVVASSGGILTQNVTFPIAFTTNVIHISTSYLETTGIASDSLYTTNQTNTGFVLGQTSTTSHTCSWFAIGW